MEHRLRLDWPDGVPAEETEAFVAGVAAELSPDMSGTFGAIHVQEAGVKRDVWTALGWQEDGSSVFLQVDQRARTIELHLTTRGLERPVQHSRWANRGVLAIIVAAIAAGVALRSLAVALGVIVLVLGTWILWDTRQQRARERRRTIDVAEWDQRLKTAVERAKSPEG